MIRKTYDGAYFKALDDGTGEFEAIVSVFGNVDLQGDRVMEGAFTESLSKWRSGGDPIPVIWSHQWGNPEAHIGFVMPTDAYEVTDESAKGFGDGILGGLYVKGKLDVDKPFARQVYDLLKDRRVKEWSFAYDVQDEEFAKDGANNLKAVDLHEIGPTLKGANPATQTLGVKSALEQAAAEDRGLKRITRALAIDAEIGMKMLKDWVTEDMGSDGEKWDGAAAMRSCSTAGDFRSIAFERANDSPPDTAAHWTLPHHNKPHGPADDGGVSAALGRLNQTGPTVMSKDSIRSHLERHQGGKSHDSEGVWEDGWEYEEKAPEAEDVMAAILEAYGIDAEKAELKPWHIEKRDDEFCVIKDSDGSSEGCHATRQDALAHMRALYASEAASEESTEEKSQHGTNAGELTYSVGGDSTTSIIIPLGNSDSSSASAPPKSGRVIGARALTSLKEALAKAVDDFSVVINGASSDAEVEKDAEADDDEDLEKAKAELEEYKRKLGIADL